MAPVQRFKNGWGRVELGDLQQPDRIDVPRFIPDNFVQPAQAPVNKDLERLAEGLGHFNRGLQQFSAKMEDDQRKKVETEYFNWLNTRTSDEALKSMREGRTWLSDPYVKDIAAQDYARFSISRLSGEIEADPNYRDQLGKPGFDAERYILEKAAPYASQMTFNTTAAKAFRQGLDGLRTGVVKNHQAALGQLQTEMIESSAMLRIDDVLNVAKRDKLDVDQTHNLLRSVYGEMGPRLKGGSLDLNYSRLDELLLQSLKKRAEDPEQAAAVVQMLRSERFDNGTGMRLGSLASVQRHRDTVDAIDRKATETLGKAWEENYKGAYVQRNAEMLKQGSPSYSAILPVDVPNPYTGARVKYSVEEQKRDAELHALAQIRGGLDKPENLPAEYESFVRSGVKHPQWFDTMSAAFSGIANMNISAKGGVAPEQVATLVEAGNRFSMLSDGARAYLEKHLGGDATKFFDQYTILTREMKMTPEQAATALSGAYASGQTTKDPEFERSRRQEIADKAKAIKFSWKDYFPFINDTPQNQLAVETSVRNLANSYGMISQVTADSAIKYAAKQLGSNGLVVNGRLVWGVPGVQPGDEQHFQPIFKDIFDSNPEYYKSKGISSPSQMSVFSRGASGFHVVGPDGFPVVVFKEGANGKPEQTVPLITPEMIQAERKKAQEEAVKGTIGAITRTKPVDQPERVSKRTLDPRVIRGQ